MESSPAEINCLVINSWHLLDASKHLAEFTGLVPKPFPGKEVPRPIQILPRREVQRPADTMYEENPFYKGTAKPAKKFQNPAHVQQVEVEVALTKEKAGAEQCQAQGSAS